MSKKVIGIAVIAGLDLAFIILMQLARDPAEISQTVAPPDRYQQSLTHKQSLPELTPSEPVAVSDNDEPVADTSAEPRTRNERISSFQKATHVSKHRRARSRRNSSVSTPPEFTDTVIYVKRSEPFQFQQVSLVEPKAAIPEPAVEIRSEPEPKKRSFISKAVPIVKKPYEWLKDLAAKLR